MNEITRWIIPIIAAGALGYTVYALAGAIRFGSRLGAALEPYRLSVDRPAHRPPGSRSGIPAWLQGWEDHLAWAQRGGAYRGWDAGRLVAAAAGYAAAAALLVLINPSPAAFALPLGAAAYPFVSVRSKAMTARRQVVRGVPELATLVAAEMSAGVSAKGALQRAAVLPGPLPGLLKEAFAAERESGLPMFGQGVVRGALKQSFTRSGLPELAAFATQLDLVAQKGVDGAALMNEIARTIGREHRSRLDSEVEKLNSRLALATAVFFFIPFVLVILGSLMAPVLALFG